MKVDLGLCWRLQGVRDARAEGGLPTGAAHREHHLHEGDVAVMRSGSIDHRSPFTAGSGIYPAAFQPCFSPAFPHGAPFPPF